MTVNNGGKTDYYNLPKPSRQQLISVLETYFGDTFETLDCLQDDLLDDVISLFPDTLNDLIEYKDMRFWRGEILKACYGLEGRMEKNKVPEQAEIRAAP